MSRSLLVCCCALGAAIGCWPICSQAQERSADQDPFGVEPAAAPATEADPFEAQPAATPEREVKEPAPKDKPAQPSKLSAEQRISKALSEPTEIAFTDTSLADVIDSVKRFHNIEIQFDSKTLEEAGIRPTEAMVTKDLKGISLRSALRLIMAGIDEQLTFVYKDEVLLITTKDKAWSFGKTLIYDVREIGDAKTIAPLLQTALAYQVGGDVILGPTEALPGCPVIQPYAHTLIISAPESGHEFVGEFLAELKCKTAPKAK